MGKHTNRGGQAFPRSSWSPHGNHDIELGLSVRDYFAAKALGALAREGIISAAIPSLAKATDRDAEWRQTMIDAVAKSAYDIADAMIKERSKA
jgi:hypothetical protein